MGLIITLEGPNMPRPDLDAMHQIRLFKYVQRVSDIIGEDEAWGLLEDLVEQGRVAWLDGRRIMPETRSDSVQRAFHLFYEEYLGLDQRDLRVVLRTPRKLVMQWRNPCPTLAACLELGLDTRMVCRRVYEGPTQSFMARIDPRLKFSRDYSRIRPHADFCEETLALNGQGSK